MDTVNAAAVDDVAIWRAVQASKAAAPAGTSASRHGRRRRTLKGGGVFNYEEIVARDKCSLDIFWLKDESLGDSAARPPTPNSTDGPLTAAVAPTRGACRSCGPIATPRNPSPLAGAPLRRRLESWH